MDTIIDANIIRRDLKLSDKNFEILLDYLAKTNSKLILPSIVVEEIKELYKRTLQVRFEEYTKSIEKLKSTLLFLEMAETPFLDIEGDAKKYLEYLKSKLGITAENIIPYKNDYLPELVNRAISRAKPLDNNGQQFRDGILWLTILDYAESTSEKIVAFVSDNPSDFSDKGHSSLSLQLLEEAKGRGVEIKFYRTLNDFAKGHASIIEFITREWIEKYIDHTIIERLFDEVLGEKQENDILGDLSLEKNETPTGSISRTNYITSNLLEYFVYEKKDGIILLNIEVELKTEYEIEIDRIIEKDNTRYDYVYRINSSGDPEMEMEYIPDYSLEHEINFRYQNAVFTGKYVISIKDNQIENYKLKDWDWA